MKTRADIVAMGRTLGPSVLDRCQALFGPEQSILAAGNLPVATDVAYGEAERQRLDLYRTGDGLQPVLLWVHGGGFLRGDKGGAHSPFNAHIGRWASRSGLAGAVMNYRLAPDAQWPSGVEDVGAAVEWIVTNGAEYGLDRSRIVLAGTSAGAVHIAGYLASGGDRRVAGAILLSGLYGFTPLDERDCLYYGDAALYPERMPLAGIVGSTLPLFVACAEFDPPRFQAETLGLLKARLDRHGAMPRAMIAGGHNHYSLAMHIGGRDTRLADEILSFIANICGAPS